MNHFYRDSSGACETRKAHRISLGHSPTPLVVASLLMCSSAFGQEPASIQLGETRLIPTLRVDYVSIDNLYRKGIDEVSGTAVLVNPELVWRADRRLLTLDAKYSGEYGVFSEDGLDYDNHDFRLRGIGNLSSKQRLEMSLSLNQGVEEQGTGQASSVLEILDEQIEVASITAQVEYGYGALDARGNLRAGVVLETVDYSNIEVLTDGDDYSVVRPYGVFSLRLSPDTRLLAEARFAALDFDDDLRDRNQVSLLTGVELSSSSKLSGNARIGMTKATFDQSTDEDTTELIAEIGLTYAPVSYTQFSFSFYRELVTEDQSEGNIGRAVNDDADLVWTHDWSSRFQTQATLSLTDADRECPDNDDRTVGVGLELNFQIRRWLQFGISGAQASRTVSLCDDSTSNSDILDYDRAVIGAHVRATL